MIHTFEPDALIHARIRETYSIAELEGEPMLYSASVEFAREHGGPITQDILNGLRPLTEYEDLFPVIDTRVHMLMPGQHPAIPGWHGDAFPRSSYEGQPDVTKGDPRVRSYICVVDDGSGCSMTEFVPNAVTVHVNPEHVWKSVDEGIELQRRHGGLHITTAAQGFIYDIGQSQLHRAQRCERRGWRMFFRLTQYHTPPQPKIRRQTQVYATPGGGW